MIINIKIDVAERGKKQDRLWIKYYDDHLRNL